jgi:hypothetical protein
MSNLITLPLEFDLSRLAKLVLAKMGFIQRGPEFSNGNPSAERGGLDVCGRFHFVADLFPVASAAAADRTGAPMKPLPTSWRGVWLPPSGFINPPLLGGPTPFPICSGERDALGRRASRFLSSGQTQGAALCPYFRIDSPRLKARRL